MIKAIQSSKLFPDLFLIFRRCIMRIMHSQRWAQRAPSCQTMKARPICSHFEEQEPVSNERAGVSGQTWNANECKWKLMANGGTGEIIWAWQVQDVLSVCRMRCVCVCVCLCHEVCHVCHVIHVYRKSSLTLQQVRHPSPTAEETTLAEASNVHRYPGHTAASNVSQKASCRPFTEQLQCKECTVLSSTYCNGIEDRHPSQFLAKIGGRWEEPSVEFPNFALASPPKKAPSQWCSSTRKVEIDMT